MDEQTIPLDRKTRALRSGNRWAVQKLQQDGSWDMVETFQGGRRSLLQWCEKHDVVPSREAEATLDFLPETGGFKER